MEEEEEVMEERDLSRLILLGRRGRRFGKAGEEERK